jgi:hypothetical protein
MYLYNINRVLTRITVNKSTNINDEYNLNYNTNQVLTHVRISFQKTLWSTQSKPLLDQCCISSYILNRPLLIR